MLTLANTMQSQGSHLVATRACLSDSSWHTSTSLSTAAVVRRAMACNLAANPARIETTAVHFATKGMTKPYRQRPKETLR